MFLVVNSIVMCQTRLRQMDTAHSVYHRSRCAHNKAVKQLLVNCRPSSGSRATSSPCPEAFTSAALNGSKRHNKFVNTVVVRTIE